MRQEGIPPPDAEVVVVPAETHKITPGQKVGVPSRDAAAARTRAGQRCSASASLGRCHGHVYEPGHHCVHRSPHPWHVKCWN